jgi:hypothetical protein
LDQVFRDLVELVAERNPAFYGAGLAEHDKRLNDPRLGEIFQVHGQSLADPRAAIRQEVSRRNSRQLSNVV